MKLKLVMAALVAVLIVPGTALAANTASQNVTLDKEKTHTGTFYAGGQTVTIDGNVEGDVVCAAQTVTINGSVKGDVLCVTQTLNINGPVSGSVRAAAQVINVNNTVGRNVTVAAQNLTTGPSAKIGGEVAVAAQVAVIGGEVTGHVYAAAQRLEINGKLADSVSAVVETVVLGRDAAVAGNFDYTSDEPLDFEKSKVEGNVAHHEPARPVTGQTSVEARLRDLLYWVSAGLLGMLAAIWLAPRLVRSVTDAMVRRWPAAIGWGAVTVLAGPLLLAMVAITFVGIPLAAVVGLLWMLALFTSGLFGGVAVGRIAWQRDDSSRRGLALSALVGVPLVLIAGWLPWVGPVIGLAMGCWAIGGMVLAANRARALG